MLKPLVPGSLLRPTFEDDVPMIMRPLVSAASSMSFNTCLQAVVAEFGFSSFMYGVTTTPRPTHQSRSYVYTTLSPEWVRRYDDMSYIEVDPRISTAIRTGTPLVWDYESRRRRHDSAAAFLDDAAEHGVGSGVSFGIHDVRAGFCVVALNSPQSRLPEYARQCLLERVGDIIALGIYFHEYFMKDVVAKGIPPRSEGAALSPREREVVSLAARGQTSGDIAFKLGIAERTVEFHFSGIRSKLAASNRQEAIAKAVAQGIVTL